VQSVSVQQEELGMHWEPHGFHPLAHWHSLAWQVSPVLQSPHDNVPPQPSETLPHCALRASQVFFRQPQWLGTPLPPQVSGETQEPQSSVPLHPSDTIPQLAPISWHVLGTHAVDPQTLGFSPPQCWPAGHAPQSTIMPHPSSTIPHWAFNSTQVLARHPH